MKPPCPRAPTTSRSASCAWSSSTFVLPPSIASERTSDARAPRRVACSRAASQMRPAIVCEASKEASTPTSLGVYQGDG